MAADFRDSGRGERPPRMRLVPPRLGEIERRTRGDARNQSTEAQRWTTGLRTTQKRRALMALGNLALLGVLLGLPFVRGHQRALAAHGAHARFLSCLYGVRVVGGLGDPGQEGERLAAQIAHGEPGWPTRCGAALAAIETPPAFFVLPSVKRAEAHARQAVQIVRTELAALATFAPGSRMPERALRSLRLLRATLREQLLAAGLNAEQAQLPQRLVAGRQLATPARVPLYAAADATLTLKGDDQRLTVAALDTNGFAYLEAQAGSPFTRARLVRPSSLRALLSFERQSWLVWATSPERCAQRGDGCFGKSMRVARAPEPPLALPAARSLAAHPAGRVDRSLAPTEAGLLIATRARDGRVSLQEFVLPTELSLDAELPPLEAAVRWPAKFDQALVLPSDREPLVLGLTRVESGWQLAQARARTTQALATLESAEPAWLSACADERSASFALGDGQRVLLGRFTPGAPGARLWSLQAAKLAQAIDPDQPQRDRVRLLCGAQAALLLMRERDQQLSALICRDHEPSCHKLTLADEVSQFSALLGPQEALIAYAGSEQPQVRVRSLELAELRLSAERVPAACWSKSGLCARPSLWRLGRRLVLATPEGTDLLLLESADEGRSWSTPPVL